MTSVLRSCSTARSGSPLNTSCTARAARSGWWGLGEPCERASASVRQRGGGARALAARQSALLQGQPRRAAPASCSRGPTSRRPTGGPQRPLTTPCVQSPRPCTAAAPSSPRAAAQSRPAARAACRRLSSSASAATRARARATPLPPPPPPPLRTACNARQRPAAALPRRQATPGIAPGTPPLTAGRSRAASSPATLSPRSPPCTCGRGSGAAVGAV